MTAQHFKELVGTIQMTKGVTQADMAKVLKIGITTLWTWQKHGVPSTKVRTSTKRLMDFYREAM